MTRAEVEACARLPEPARSRALATFAALDSLSITVDEFCENVAALRLEADSQVRDDVDAE
jgi:hypothetical protein